MSFSIEGRVAIITGAATGIGLAVARHFADAGARIMIVDKNEKALVQERDGMPCIPDNVRHFSGDICQKLTVANLLTATLDEFDRVDILVNACLLCRSSDPIETPAEDDLKTINQNVMANLRLTRRAARQMVRQSRSADNGFSGSIVNISSIAPERPHPNFISFTVSCSAVNQLTRSFAAALAGNGIRVNAVAVGSVMSGFLQVQLKQHPELRKAVLQATPIGRIAEAQEVAEAVHYLSAPGSRFVTGQILKIDGGSTLTGPLNEFVP